MKGTHSNEGYCIAKPKILSTASNQQLSSSQKSFIQFDCEQIKIGKSPQQHIRLSWKKNLKSHAQIRRSYDMICKQINNSAAVSINFKDKIQNRKKYEQKEHHNFIQNFEQIYQKLIPHHQNDDNFLTLRKSCKKTTKFTKFITHHNLSEDQKQSQENLRNGFEQSIQKQQNIGYYARLKRRLGMKVDDIIQKHPKNRLCSEIQNKDDRDNVSKVIKQKVNLKNNGSFLRLSRTGLIVKLSDIQRRAKGTNLAMIQNQKAKKDFIFQRCLSKNCQIVLEEIKKYERATETSLRSDARTSESSKLSNNFLDKTHSSQQKLHSNQRNTISDINMLRWRQKCLQIEINCKKNYKKNRNIKLGMKIFHKYCNQLHKKLQYDEKTLIYLLNHDKMNEEMYQQKI